MNSPLLTSRPLFKQANDFQPRLLDDVIRLVLEILWRHPQGVSAREILPPLARAYIGSGDPNLILTERDELDVRIALYPLFRVGWLVKDADGFWHLSEEGRQACKGFAGAQELYNQAQRQLNEDLQAIPEVSEVAAMAQEKAREQAGKYLHTRRIPELRSMLAHLTQTFGYHLSWLAPPEKTYGQVDMIATSEPLQMAGPRIFIQIKHKGQPMTVEGLKAFSAILSEGDSGLIFSTGGFTRETRATWDSEFSRKINLLDTRKFFDLWVANYSKLSPQAQGLLPLKAIYFLSFHE